MVRHSWQVYQFIINPFVCKSLSSFAIRAGHHKQVTSSLQIAWSWKPDSSCSWPHTHSLTNGIQWGTLAPGEHHPPWRITEVADRPQAGLGQGLPRLVQGTSKGCDAAHQQDLTGTLTPPWLSWELADRRVSLPPSLLFKVPGGTRGQNCLRGNGNTSEWRQFVERRWRWL